MSEDRKLTTAEELALREPERIRQEREWATRKRRREEYAARIRNFNPAIQAAEDMKIRPGNGMPYEDDDGSIIR